MESPSLSESNYASREQIDTRSTSVPYVTDFSNNSIRYKNSPKTSPYVQNDSLVSDNEEIGNLQDRLLNLQRERLKEQSENENAKKDMSGRIRFLEDTVSKLNNTIDNLQDKNTSMNEFISTTKERADYLEKSKKDVEEENKSVLEKVQKLEHELRDERERSMMSDGSLDVYHAQILNLQKENQQLQDALQQEYNAKDNDQIALLHQNSILEGRVNQEMEEVEFHRKSFEKASFANDELRRENEILLHQMRKIQRDLDVEFERHEEKEKSLRTDLETAAQSFELIHQDKAAILNELNATVANLREENEQLSSALKNMTKDQISHHEALQKEAQKHVSDVQVLNRKITQVQDELRDSQTINAKLNSALQDKQRELSLKSEKIVVLTEQFADMERQYKNLLVCDFVNC
jgi:chromosome segregation ATPase